MDKQFAQVIVNNKASQVDKPFTYLIDGDLIGVVKEGMRVIVPFGIGNKMIKGIVIKIEDFFKEDYKLKRIIDVLDDKPLISKELIELSLWISKNYLSSYIDAFQPVLPPGDFKQVNTFVELVDNNSKIDIMKINEDEKKLLHAIENEKKILLEDLKKKYKIVNINKVLNSLENMGIIETTIDIKTTVEKKYEKWVSFLLEDIPLIKVKELIGGRSPRQLEIGEYLYNIKEISLKSLIEELNTTLATIKALEKKGIIHIFDKEVSRDPIKKNIEHYKKHTLSNSQRRVFERILGSINQNEEGNKFLIHGITGSGKTEIYLQLVEEILKLGRDSIILVPEISLTPQTIERFVGRFGNKVAVLHSKLSQGERFDEWRRIKEGKVKIVVGARSAVFAPFNNLGLIIIDEEHETTYKSSQNPKYDAIEVAAKRCELEKAYLVMGSATPSIETYYNSLTGDITLLKLEERINNTTLPQVKVIDMRQELDNGNKSMFSKELYEAMEKNLISKKQTILFLNRRGFSTFVSCRKCGYVVKCNNCDISMTYHRNTNKLICHYCGVAINPPTICPVCRSNYIKYFGVGTEKVEQYTRKLFPQGRIMRMDMDTTTKKGSYEKILDDMKKRNIDILIGTQMVSKGLDFKDVTLVGIIAADTTLNLPDFRSPERTFQLITQVAGRAGRGDFEGKVILQTYSPEHYSIQYAKEHDYINYYDAEIALRKEFLYPPFINLISILIYGENNSKVASIAKEVYNIIINEIEDINKEDLFKYIIGPYPAPLERIKNNYRWQILIKVESQYMNSLRNIINQICILNKYNLNFDNIKFSIDINPNSIL